MSDHADRHRPPGATLIDLAQARRRLTRGASPSSVETQPEPEPHAPEPQPPDPALVTQREFDRESVARILGISPRRARAWERAGLLTATAPEGRYSFRDLRAARIVRDLVQKGIRPARVRAMLVTLERMLPEDAESTVGLPAIRVQFDGSRVVARDEAGTFEVPSGQGMLDFATGAASVRALPTRPRTADGRTAYEWFLEGCRLDGDEATRTRAEHAYRKAVALDGSLASAWTNLGALHLSEDDRDEARECFTRAMECDPSQPEAPYNVGYLLLEEHKVEAALPLLAKAVALDPGFADAHFNLAAALDELGRREEASTHWELYLELLPTGPFADVARARLSALNPRAPKRRG
jgi:DNA-binding transcriptional MerR regulator